MNRVNISGFVTNDVEKDINNPYKIKLMEIDNVIKADNEVRARFFIIVLVNGYLETDCEISVTIESNDFNKNLEFEKISLKKENIKGDHVDFRYIIEIDVAFPGEGQYNVISKITNNAIEESYLTDFTIINSESK